jgi:DNA/RNA endonuclease G (NUC1)
MKRLLFLLIAITLFSCTKEPIIAQTVTKPVTNVDTTKKNNVVYSGEGETPIKADTVINNGILISYFSYKTRTPLFVVYNLYHGGGTCDRSTMHFITGNVKNSATDNDYSHSGYDIGHMTPAEDEAYDCNRETLTFFYYNALPQTPNLNRGCWKHRETLVRKYSQTDSLLIICGGFGFNIKISDVSVPDFCFKIIKNLKTGKIESFIYNNTNKAKEENIDIKLLLSNIAFSALIKNIL